MKKILRILTPPEWALWLGSMTVVSVSFIVIGGGNIAQLIATLMGLTSLIFIAKGMIVGQYIGVVFCLAYAYVSFCYSYYGEVIIYLAMQLPISIITIINWHRHPYGRGRVKIAPMTAKKAVTVLLLACIVIVGFYFILRALGTANLIFSAVSVGTSFIALAFSMLRSPFYAAGYIVNDIILIVLWSLAVADNLDNLPMLICFIMFLLNDTYGFINWQRMKKAQNNDKEEES